MFHIFYELKIYNYASEFFSNEFEKKELADLLGFSLTA